MLKSLFFMLTFTGFAFSQTFDLDDLKTQNQNYDLDELQKSGVDGLEVVGGYGEGSDNYRLVVGWEFFERGVFGGNWTLSGTLAGNLSQMDHQTLGTGDEGSLTDVGITPVWTLYNERFARNLIKPYLEFGIGLHYLSEKEVGVKTFSTNFQFGDHIGVGVKFGPREAYKVTYQFQHLSNGGLDAPNPGINFHLLSFGYSFGN